MTVDEIKQELDVLNIDYPSEARKQELEALLAKVKESAAKGPVGEPDTVEPKLQEEPEAAIETVAVACPLLNLRDTPDGDVVGIARDGEEFEVIDDCGEWVQIRTMREVWARSEFLA